MINIVAEHADFLLVDKPPGRDFHDSDAAEGFFNQVKREVGRGGLWPVHRLDKPTSGLLLMAKNKFAAAQLSDAFAKQQITKRYLAIAEGKPKKKQGKIQGDMERGRRGSWRLGRSSDNPAVTLFHSVALQPGYRLYALQPKTGRTHQLRVAMKSLSTPILGDALYAGRAADRTYLHAYEIAFDYGGERFYWSLLPQSGEQFTSAQFVAALAQLQQKYAGAVD